MTGYAELHCKTNYSFLEGASHADELVATAKERGYAAIAVTDRDSLAGVVRAHVAAKEHGLKLIVGAEIHPVDAPAVVLWATDRKAYGRLCRLITLGRCRADKGQCELTLEDIAAHAGGLLAGVVPPQSMDDDIAPMTRYRDLFGERAYLLAELFRGPDDARRLRQLQDLSLCSLLPLVAANDVRYHTPARLPLHDVLTAIRHGTTVATAGDQLFPNAERHLRHIDEIMAAFAGDRAAVHRTLEVAERCTFNLDELRYEYPEELVPAGSTPSDYLTKLTWCGAANRYPGGVPDKVRHLIERELVLIRELRYEAYFLTVHDLVVFARSRAILCQGRGSAANSAVCFCLGVTSVDPEHIDLLFERFISKERNEAPDIDVDFEHERREEVLQYLYTKYGRERAGLAATVITYRARSAVRDVGKALGLSLDRVDALAKQTEGHGCEDRLDLRCLQVGIDPTSPLGAKLVHLVNEIQGFPRHLSQHVGGMVMTRGPLCELVPIENAAMADRTVVQWDKDDLDALGILKVDVLALGMLTAIRKCFTLVEQHHGRPLELATVPQDDPRVYDMICAADTIGVFQIESRGQMSMLPRLKPRTYYDLVIEVAIMRPGPIQGEMVHPYLRRRKGEETVSYPNDAIRAVLEKTLGVPLFQEQAMQLAVVAAGFTPGEADQLRRAMGAWRRTGVMDRFRDKLLNGMRERGLSGQFAEQVFNMIRGFGEYGFPESHAASFALLVYVSAWLKHYYPAAFAASLINSQPMGFYAPAQLIQCASRHGVQVLSIDVNESEWDCTLESSHGQCWLGFSPEGAKQNSPGRQPWVAAKNVASPEGATQDVPPLRGYLLVGEDTQGLRPGLCCTAPSELQNRGFYLRLGFRLVSGLRQATVDTIVAAREDGPFCSMQDFIKRTRLGRSALEILSDADAFGSLMLDRRNALWHSLAQSKAPSLRSLFASVETASVVETLPELSPFEQIIADYRTIGLSLKGHPMKFFREQLDHLHATPADRLPELTHGRRVRVAGLIILRQRPSTAKGITFCTMEDETGIANLVVHPRTWEQYYSVARRSQAWCVDGTLEQKDSVTHVVARRIEDLPAKLGNVRIRSRDFR